MFYNSSNMSNVVEKDIVMSVMVRGAEAAFLTLHSFSHLQPKTPLSCCIITSLNSLPLSSV